MKVVVLSPVNNSLYSKLVLKLCHEEPGVEVAGIVVRRILNLNRVRSELKRDGVRLVRKAWKKLVLGGDVRDSSAGETGFYELARDQGVGQVSVSRLAKELGVPCLRVGDHNDADSVRFLERVKPDVVAFTGGGLIRQSLLEASGRGIFNAHMGVLPAYRGMDVVEWPLVEEQSGTIGIGVTLHFMARGVDTGPIALIERVSIRPGDSMERLRKRFEPAMLGAMLKGIRAARDGTLDLKAQRAEEGRQYFVMHPRFYEIARKKLAAIAGA